MSGPPESKLGEAAQDMLARWRVRSAMLALLPFVALGVYGARVEFFASPAWWGLTPWISVVAGVGATALGYRAIFWGRVRPQSYQRAVLSGALLLFGPPIVFTLLSGCIFTRALPDIYTRVAGDPHEVTTVLDKKRVRLARGTCHKRITGAPFESGSLLRYYCADAREWLVVQNFRRVKLVVRKSWFGIHVERIDPADPAPPVSPE